MKTNISNIMVFKNNSGYSLILTLFAIVLISVLGLSILTVTSNTLKISSHEREDQAVYYIAETALTETRAKIVNEISTTKNEVLSLYESKSKKENSHYDPYYNPIEDFKSKVLLRINTAIGEVSYSIENPKFNQFKSELPYFQSNYEEQPKANYAVILTIPTENNGNIKYTIRTQGEIDGKFRSLTQDININPSNLLNLEDNLEDEDPDEDSEESEKNRLNACFAVYANGAISSSGGGGSINGDIYSNKPLTISGSPTIDGNIYSTENIKITGTPTSVKNIISNKNIELTGWNIISGSIQAGGFVNSNANISGRILSKDGISINGGTVSNGAKTNGTFTMSNGEVQKNIVANNNIIINGGTSTGDVVSNKDVSIINWPTLKGNIISKNNINFNQENYNLKNGKLILGGTTNSKANTIEKPSNIDDIIRPYLAPIQAEIPNLSDSIDNECTTGIITLPPENNTFKTPVGDYVADRTIRVNNNSYNIIKNHSLMMNNYQSDNYTLELNQDIYFKSMDFKEGNELNIDLQGKEIDIYVDTLDMFNGFINVQNGKLNMHVLNTLTIGNGAINANGNISDVNIYYSGISPITIAGGVDINSSLYVKNSDLTLTAGGRVNGDVFVFGQNKITLSGGASSSEQLFLAPKSDMTVTGGAKINGNVIANNYTFDGGTTISPPLKDVPYEPDTPPPPKPNDPSNPETETPNDDENLDDLFKITAPKEI